MFSKLTSNIATVIATIAVFAGTAGCSIYQSEGRKYLEKNAIQFSQAAAANLQSCGPVIQSENWQKASEHESAEVFSSDSSDFTVMVVPRSNAGTFNCTYKFSSVQEMIERTDSAVELTMEQMALGLVP